MMVDRRVNRSRKIVIRETICIRKGRKRVISELRRWNVIESAMLKRMIEREWEKSRTQKRQAQLRRTPCILASRRPRAPRPGARRENPAHSSTPLLECLRLPENPHPQVPSKIEAKKERKRGGRNERGYSRIKVKKRPRHRVRRHRRSRK